MYTIYRIKLNLAILPENEIIQFVDDTVIINRNKKISSSTTQLQTNVEQVVKYCESIGLEIGPEKSQLIIFSKKTIKEQSLQIKIEDQIILNQKSVKYLGLILDSKLHWNHHAKYISEKVYKLINKSNPKRDTYCRPHT